MLAQISFVHSEYPAACASPNLISANGHEAYPGFSGTGFFAKRGNAVFYITARHCLTKDEDGAVVAEAAARLHVPYALEAKTHSTDDYVQFDEVLSAKHECDDIPGSYVDVLLLTVRKPADASLFNILLKRAVKLPPSGEWLDRFIKHPVAKDDFELGNRIRFTVIGYPYHGTASNIDYPDGKPVEIVTQAAKFSGYLGKGVAPDRYKLNEVDWSADLNGFSGSPVIVGFRDSDGDKYALAGMIVTAGPQLVQFIRVSWIAAILKGA